VKRARGGRGEGVLSWQILNEKCGMRNALARRDEGRGLKLEKTKISMDRALSGKVRKPIKHVGKYSSSF
jgi:hypothetical protein